MRNADQGSGGGIWRIKCNIGVKRAINAGSDPNALRPFNQHC